MVHDLCIFLSWFRLEEKWYYGIWILDGSFNLKLVNDEFVSYKHTDFHFTRDELMDWSGVDYWDVFISCLDSRSDGTHSTYIT